MQFDIIKNIYLINKITSYSKNIFWFDVDVKIPWKVGRQVRRSNTEKVSPKVYFSVSLYIPTFRFF